MENELNNQMNSEYLQFYAESLNENLANIIKQNIILQTNLKITEQNLAKLVEKDKENFELLSLTEQIKKDNFEMKSKLMELESNNASYKIVADDRMRLQVALNEVSQEKNKLQSEVNTMQQELLRLRSKVEKFEKVETVETTKSEIKPLSKVDVKKETKTVKSKSVDSKSSVGTF